MDLTKLSDEEKSVLLARAMGWEIRLIGASSCVIDNGEYLKVNALEYPDLYDPHDMALAWRVLNWATDTERRNNEEMCLWWEEARLHNRTPADAQRLWLDKILELAIEAGIVELTHELD